ncbi:MAG TPA: cytochrome c maturation protein CcmE [Polyangiaceae bacterium]|nr:cytochrome c maturation protein CcmE [Polyangiaceae bacterium]
MSKKLLAASLAAGAGILVVAFRFESKPMYRVGDFLARDVRDQEVKVQGLLVRGSLCRVQSDCGFRFSIADHLYQSDAISHSRWSRPTLAVSHDGCFLPDTFRDQPGVAEVTVTVQGERCQTCHDFKATQLMAKCSCKYEMGADGGVHFQAPTPPLCDALKPRM